MPASGVDRRDGAVAGIVAYGLWGLLPLYWRALGPGSASGIVADRIVWSLVVAVPVVAVLAVRGPGPRARFAFLGRGHTTALLTTAAAVIAVNWWVYIWAVDAGHVLDTALGYYINPLVTVGLGVVGLRERLRRVQWVALGLGAAAVVEMILAAGTIPWIALLLAGTFGSYGLLKKSAGAPALESLTVETAVLVLPALAWLAHLGRRHGAPTAAGTGHLLLVMGTGVVTLVPLVAFAAAATRLPLVNLGLLQYLAPTLQFVLGLTVFGEGLSLARFVGFALVWAALTVLAADSLRARGRRVREGGLAGTPVADPSR
jgi:chloramphenicol-sensitive protein RarD